MRISRTAAALAAALALTACSTKATNSSSGGSDSAGVKTDTGVTAGEITLGVMTDKTGAFKTLGLGVLHGNELWAKDFNDAGGVCGRKVKLEVVDHSYKADTAKTLYPQIEPKVAGFLQLLGSPIVAALKENLGTSKIVTAPVSWSSELLNLPNLMVVGTTYDLEMINGLSFLKDKGLLADGSTVGHIYIKSEYGQNALRGAKYWAEKHKVTIKEVGVNPTDVDMTNIVTGLKGAGVSAILLSGSPAQTASVAAANQSLGMNVPMLGSNPSFDYSLITGPAAGALEKYHFVGSTVPFGADVPKAKDVASKYKAAHQEPGNHGIPYGYAVGQVWASVLAKACANKDLTRAGIAAALAQTTTADTNGLVGNLDFSKKGAPATRSAYIARADKAIDGGLKIIAPLFESSDAKGYQAPHQQ